MSHIQVGGTAVKVPGTLDLELERMTPSLAAPSPHSTVLKRRAQFLALFSDAHDPRKVLPVQGHAVFILDANRVRQFVHVAKYCGENKNFESDGGWFETTEIDLWSYVPCAENEAERRLIAESGHFSSKRL